MVFPEGGGYTHSKILQVLPGAAWAAVEFARYLKEKKPKETGKGRGIEEPMGNAIDSGLRIVPVAIVYTDKSKYLSRVSEF